MVGRRAFIVRERRETEKREVILIYIMKYITHIAPIPSDIFSLHKDEFVSLPFAKPKSLRAKAREIGGGEEEEFFFFSLTVIDH